MSFAEHYIRKHCIFPNEITEPPQEGLNITIIIPCFNEPSLINTLESLWNCYRPACPVEVIIVINSGESAQESIIRRNNETEAEAYQWIIKHNHSDFRFYIIVKRELPGKHAGVGLARKIGMDEAIYRFNSVNNPGGILVSFDADSLCDKNFIREIEHQFKMFPRTNACSVYFEHPLEGTEYSAEVYEAIAWYELYLRYYQAALKYSGFPYSYHTIGSCFAVKASVYAKQGGMNRRQAGEDFYFLQKIIPLGDFFEINTTRVIPSPRPSLRAPFGTGASIQKYLNNNSGEPEIYNLQAFKDMKLFFEMIPLFFRKPGKEILSEFSTLANPLVGYLEKYSVIEKIKEIDDNSSNPERYTKRFYQYFNAFRILKFLNFAHESGYKRMPLSKAVIDLLETNGVTYSDTDVKHLLETFRKIF